MTLLAFALTGWLVALVLLVAFLRGSAETRKAHEQAHRSLAGWNAMLLTICGVGAAVKSATEKPQPLDELIQQFDVDPKTRH